MTQSAICYIVPSHGETDSSHMAHLPRFLDEVGRRCRLHVIVQRAVTEPVVPSAASVYVQRHRGHMGRALELIRSAQRLKRAGCRRFFVRISSSAAFVLGVWSRVVGAEVFYWQSCERQDLVNRTAAGRGRFAARVFRLLLMRINVKLARKFVTGPERMLEYYRTNLGLDRERVVLLYNDIDLDRVRAERGAMSQATARSEIGVPKAGSVVLFVGRVSYRKGGHYLLPLAERLALLAPATSLLVVGDGSQMPSLPGAARRSKLENIRFYGSVPQRQIGPYYMAADVFVLPSEAEGFPRRVLEAMAYGLPLVSFDVGGVRDIVSKKHQEFIVRRGDVDEMVRAICRLLSNSSLRDEQARAGEMRVERFGTERIAEMFIRNVVSPR